MTNEEDIASIAAQLADLTRHVNALEEQLKERVNFQQARADTQQERIDLAARELAEVSHRLQLAANALRESICRSYGFFSIPSSLRIFAMRAATGRVYASSPTDWPTLLVERVSERTQPWREGAGEACFKEA